jgi:hypothetical protein
MSLVIYLSIVIISSNFGDEGVRVDLLMFKEMQYAHNFLSFEIAIDVLMEY